MLLLNNELISIDEIEPINKQELHYELVSLKLKKVINGIIWNGNLVPFIGVEIMIKALNHICFSVSNLQKSIYFYDNILKAKLLVEGKTTAYFDLNGIWLALNQEEAIPREEIKYSYTHIAFSIEEQEFGEWYH